MRLDDLTENVQDSYHTIDDEVSVSLDREAQNELALLEAALDPEDTDELVRRAIHLFFQTTVDSGKLDFQLRSEYDATYDEFLSGMTFEQMTGADQYPSMDDERRYQF